jgi:hypothetical protein
VKVIGWMDVHVHQKESEREREEKEEEVKSSMWHKSEYV